MKILMIEDNRDSIEGIIDFCNDEKYECKVKNFEEGVSYIEQYNPDIIILDLKNDIDERFVGCDILDKVWEKSFRPVCVFSGQINESTVDSNAYNSPLVKFYNKGDETPIIEYIKKVAPYMDSINNVRKRTNEAMRCAFDYFDLAIEDNITDAGIISYLCSNRIKAYFDKENENKDMPAWSQYVYPVLDKRFMMGDIIRKKSHTESGSMEGEYFVILSQSCDICNKKIDQVLVAQGDKISSIGSFKKKQKDKYIAIFNTGFDRQFFPLPKICTIMPDLAINLKRLFLVQIDQLGDLYEKVASLSSPYKERLIWAYMNNACRPGVPDLAVEDWLEKLMPDEVETKQ